MKTLCVGHFHRYHPIDYHRLFSSTQTFKAAFSRLYLASLKDNMYKLLLTLFCSAECFEYA